MSDRRITEFFAEFEPPEGVRAELLRGEIVLTASPDLVHNANVATVQDQIPRQRWRRLQTQRVAIPEEPSEPQPDLVVIERGAGPDGGRLMPAEVITLLVEDADYRCRRITKFGDLTPLEPIGIELDTSEFATYEKVTPHRRP